MCACTSSGSQFGSKRIDGAPSKMSSWLSAGFKVYGPLNETIDALPDSVAPDYLVNLDVYQYHLERLPAYNNNAKWMSQAAPPTPAAEIGPRTPGMNPVLGSPNLIASPLTLPTPPTANDGPPPGWKYAPGQIRPDGSFGPPVLVPEANTPIPQYMPQMNPGMGMPAQGVMQSPWGQPQPQMMYPQQYMGQPSGGVINPLMFGNQPPQQQFGGFNTGFNPGLTSGFSGIPGMPTLR